MICSLVIFDSDEDAGEDVALADSLEEAREIAKLTFELQQDGELNGIQRVAICNGETWRLIETWYPDGRCVVPS